MSRLCATHIYAEAPSRHSTALQHLVHNAGGADTCSKASNHHLDCSLHSSCTRNRRVLNSPVSLLRVLLGVQDSLRPMHDKMCVHGDIKPVSPAQQQGTQNVRDRAARGLPCSCTRAWPRLHTKRLP